MTKKEIRDAFSNDLDNIYIITIKRGKEYKVKYYKITPSLQRAMSYSFISRYIQSSESVLDNFIIIKDV